MAVSWARPESWSTEDWRPHASCRSAGPDLFFPIGTTGPAVDQIEAAKMVCRQCPVQAPCLEYAIATHQDSGVWGATSEEERRTLRRQRQRLRSAQAV